MDDLNKTVIAVAGMICITFLEYCAIQAEMNGVALASVIGAIAAIVGFAFGFKFKEIQVDAESKE